MGLFWSPSRRVDYNATIARNDTSSTGSLGILRNSVNNQWTIGAISKLSYQVNADLKITAGLDWRTAEIDHFREVRDLLGGDYYVYNGNQVGLGGKIAYNYTNNVDWLGFFVDGEYTLDQFTAYGMYGLSTIKYKHDNIFGNFKVESENIIGHQLKGGALFNLSENLDVYTNIGFASKVPIFDNVIDDGSGAINNNPENEKFIATEGGINFSALNGVLAITFNSYITIWKDRAFTRSVQTESGSDALISINGVEQMHMGVELETAYQPTKMIRIDASASFGKWEYTDNVDYSYRPDLGRPETESGTLYIKDLKVANAPQTQFSYALTAYPIENLYFSLVEKSFFNHYSDFDPLDRTDADEEGEQTWKIPNYSLFDIHMSYSFSNLINGMDVEVFANMFNIFDTTFIQDATDNSRYNAFKDNGVNHSVDDAEVYFGLPRSYNFGIRVNF